MTTTNVTLTDGEDATQQVEEYSITVTYDANGGSGEPSAQTFTGTSASISCTLSTTVPKRSAYTFVGWSLDSTDDLASYSAGDSITLSSSVTLYAVWMAVPGLVYINGAFYTPYVYVDGWKKADAYIYDSQWKVTMPPSN